MTPKVSSGFDPSRSLIYLGIQCTMANKIVNRFGDISSSAALRLPSV